MTGLIYLTEIMLILIGYYLVFGGKTRLSYYYSKRNTSYNYYQRLIKKIKLVDFGKARRKKRVEKEIYEGISFMRNLITLNAGKKIRADILIEKLGAKKGVLQPAYVKMLGLLRINRTGEAVTAFYDEIGVATSENEFASLLVKWDELDPEELREILISIQRSARERRITEQKKKDEIISDLIYLPVVFNVFVIFINLLYVSFFLNQQEMLMNFI